MRLKESDMVREFAEKNNLNYSEIAEMVKCTWEYVKSQMSVTDFKSIRLKYFGLFFVIPSRATQVLNSIEILHSSGRMPDDEYEKYINDFKKYMNSLENRNENEDEDETED